MMIYNVYIEWLLKRRAVFLIELLDLKFFLKMAKITTKLENNFANNVKKRNN